MLYLVRHDKAGKRGVFDGPDEERPLNAGGRKHAAALAERLAERVLHTSSGADAPRILASPALRCIQTVEPLAARLDLEVEVTPVLAEGHPFAEVLDLLEDLPDGSVLCSHGDVIPDVIDALMRRGMEVTGKPDWRKGATWVLERHDDGSIVRGYAEAP